MTFRDTVTKCYRKRRVSILILVAKMNFATDCRI